MSFTAPVADQRLILNAVVGIGELANGPDAEMVDAVLEGAAALAEGEFAPLLRTGDTVGARWDNGTVTMPDGFKAGMALVCRWRLDVPCRAGRAWRAGAALHVLSAALMDDLNAANVGFALCPMLSMGAIEALERHGSDELKRDYLPNIVSGEWPATMNLTEPQAGSDVGALKTRAEPVGRWQLAGHGAPRSSSPMASMTLATRYSTWCWHGPPARRKARGASRCSWCRRSCRTAAHNDLRCVSIEHKLGIHASPTCVMSYGDHERRDRLAGRAGESAAWRRCSR